MKNKYFIFSTSLVYALIGLSACSAICPCVNDAKTSESRAQLSAELNADTANTTETSTRQTSTRHGQSAMARERIGK